MRLLKCYSDVASLKQCFPLHATMTEYMKQEWLAFCNEMNGDEDDHETLLLGQNHHIALLEETNKDLSALGLCGTLREQWPEYVELVHDEGAQDFYRIGIMPDNECFILLYVIKGTLDPETEAWLAEQAHL